MKVNFFLLVIMLSALSAICQKNNEHSSVAIYEPDARETLTKIIGSDKDGIYFMTTALKGLMAEGHYRFHKYDNKTMKKVWSKEFTLEKAVLNNAGSSYDEVMLVNGNILFFYSRSSLKEKSEIIKVKAISDKGEVTDVDWEGMKIEGFEPFGIAHVSLKFALSPDSSKLLILKKYMYKHEDVEVSNYVVFDTKALKTVGHGTIPEKWNNRSIMTNHLRCDNEGNLFFLCCVVPNKKENVVNMFATIPKATNKMNVVELKLDINDVSNNDLFKKIKESNSNKEDANEISYEFLDNKKVLVAGFYHQNTKTDKESKAGVFQYIIETPDLTIKSNKQQLFDAEMENRIRSIVGKKSEGSAYKDYKVNEMVITGSTVWLLGSVLDFIGNNNDGTPRINRYDWLAFNLSPGNGIASSFFVPYKNMEFGSPGLTIPVYKSKNDLIWLITFDEGSIKEIKKADVLPDKIKSAVGMGGSIFPATLNEKGLESVTHVSGSEDMDIITTPNHLIVGNRILIVYAKLRNGIAIKYQFSFIDHP